MKKIMILMVLAVAMIFVAKVWATPVGPTSCLKVELDPSDSSVVVITGASEDVSRQNYMVQYLPDDFRDQDLNKIVVAADVISPTQRKFKMSKDGLKYGLIGFNFAQSAKWTAENIWLGIASEYVLMGPGIRMTMSSYDANIALSGGAHFLNMSGDWKNFLPAAGFIEGNGTACGAKPVAKGPCVVFLKGDKARTDVLKSIIGSYWGAQVQVESGTGHEVVVTGSGGTRNVPISDKLLADLQKLVGNPNAGSSLNSLCPEQAKLLREAVKCD